MLPLLAAALLAAIPVPEVTKASAREVLDEVRRPGASAVVVNLWATWCQPCREEFPDLVRLGREYRERGLRVVFVSTDFVAEREQALKFLASQGVGGRSFIKDEGSDMTFIDAIDPRWTGVIPATFLYDGTGRNRWFHEGKTDYATVKTQIEAVLADAAGPPSPPPPGQEKKP
jgi:thiol-disulfide isomerase/thioredoxin